MYITNSCLVYCRAPDQARGAFYDPCSGTGVDCGTSSISFTYAGFSGRAVSPEHPRFCLGRCSPLAQHALAGWRGSGRGRRGPDGQRTLDNTLRGLPKGLDTVNVPALLRVMLVPVRAILEAGHAAGEGTDAPDAYCDDLFDYWAEETQHPVGYHPTTASTRADTRMRGFASWMSAAADDSTAWRIDPRRFRDYDMFSHAYGAAHLTCDRSVYGKEGCPSTPFTLRQNGTPTARATPPYRCPLCQMSMPT